MFQKIFRTIFCITFLLGVLLLIKPVYFYSRGILIQYILANSWDTYKNNGIIAKSWFDIYPIGKLTIDNILLNHIILDGSNDHELSYGLGRVNGSALLHEKKQNIIIAGHRDSFFKELKYITKNDQIVLEHIEGKSIYKVDQIVITNPFDSSYITDNKKNTLTLITCFPFNFIGDAPKRFIVECSLVEN